MWIGRINLLALGLACTLVGCTTTSASDDNGQTGSPGGMNGGTAGTGPSPSPCSSSCDDQLKDVLDELLGPDEEPISIVGSRCVWGQARGEHRDAQPTGMYCECEAGEDAGTVDVSWLEAGCAYRGAHSHDCLIKHGELLTEPCDPEDPDACEGLCEELDSRITADAEDSTPYHLRSTECTVLTWPDRANREPETVCNGAVEIGGSCYPASIEQIYWNSWKSCELSDSQIRGAQSVNPDVDCNAIPATAPPEVECRFACVDASDCSAAQGCLLGETAITRHGDEPTQPACGSCWEDIDCLPSEKCAGRACLLPANVHCVTDADCEENSYCTVMGLEEARDPRGNSTAISFCEANQN